MQANQVNQTPRTLSDIETELSTVFTSLHDKQMRAGELLSNAKEFFEVGTQWLAWAKDKFGLGKTNVFKLVKVYTLFGTDSRFQGAPIQALYLLSQCGDDKIVEQAAELARDGALTLKVVSELIEPTKASKKKKEDKKEEATTVAESDTSAPWATDTESEESAEDTKATIKPAPVVAEAEPVQPVKEVEPVQQVQPVQPVQSEDLRALVKELELLRAQLAEMQAENMQLKKDLESGKGSSAESGVLPTLPHLKSDDMRVRLGLTVAQAEDLKEIKRESRYLIKLFKGNNEALKLIKEATAALLA